MFLFHIGRQGFRTLHCFSKSAAVSVSYGNCHWSGRLAGCCSEEMCRRRCHGGIFASERLMRFLARNYV